MQRDWPESDTGVDGERETETETERLREREEENDSCTSLGRKELEETQ